MRTLPRVLIVSGAAGSGDGFYLSRALTAGGDEGPDMDVRTVHGSDFVAMSGAQLHDQTVVVLLSTHGIDRRVRDSVRSFLERGGGLFIAAAERPRCLGPLDRPRLDASAEGARACRTRRPDRDRFAPSHLQAVCSRRREPGAGLVRAGLAGRCPGRLAGRREIYRWGGGAPRTVRPARAGSCCSRRISTDDGTIFRSIRSTCRSSRRLFDILGRARPPRRPCSWPTCRRVFLPGPASRQRGGRTLAINVDPRESTIDRVGPAEFARLVTRTSADTKASASRVGQLTEAKQQYWQYGLILMLGVLIAEAFVGAKGS